MGSIIVVVRPTGAVSGDVDARCVRNARLAAPITLLSALPAAVARARNDDSADDDGMMRRRLGAFGSAVTTAAAVAGAVVGVGATETSGGEGTSGGSGVIGGAPPAVTATALGTAEPALAASPAAAIAASASGGSGNGASVCEFSCRKSSEPGAGSAFGGAGGRGSKVSRGAGVTPSADRWNTPGKRGSLGNRKCAVLSSLMVETRSRITPSVVPGVRLPRALARRREPPSMPFCRVVVAVAGASRQHANSSASAREARESEIAMV